MLRATSAPHTPVHGQSSRTRDALPTLGAVGASEDSDSENRTGRISSVTLNALEICLSGESFTAWHAPMPNNVQFDELRADLEVDWFLRWQGGQIDGMPWAPQPTKVFGVKTRFQFDEKPQFVAALFVAQLRRWLLARFPKGRIIGHRPVTMVPTRDEVVSAVLTSLNVAPNVLSVVERFRIWRQFDFDAKLIESHPGSTQIALVISPRTRWEILAPLPALDRHGIDLRGLMVVRRERQPGERRLVGRIERIEKVECFSRKPMMA